MLFPTWVVDRSSVCFLCLLLSSYRQADNGVLQYPLQGEVYTFCPTWVANRSSLCSVVVVHSSNVVALPFIFVAQLQIPAANHERSIRRPPLPFRLLGTVMNHCHTVQGYRLLSRILHHNQTEGNTDYHMELRNHHVPVLLVYTVHTYTQPAGILNTKTVAIPCLTALRVLCPESSLGLAFAPGYQRAAL